MPTPIDATKKRVEGEKAVVSCGRKTVSKVAALKVTATAMELDPSKKQVLRERREKSVASCRKTASKVNASRVTASRVTATAVESDAGESM